MKQGTGESKKCLPITSCKKGNIVCVKQDIVEIQTEFREGRRTKSLKI